MRDAYFLEVCCDVTGETCIEQMVFPLCHFSVDNGKLTPTMAPRQWQPPPHPGDDLAKMIDSIGIRRFREIPPLGKIPALRSSPVIGVLWTSVPHSVIAMLSTRWKTETQSCHYTNFDATDIIWSRMFWYHKLRCHQRRQSYHDKVVKTIFGFQPIAVLFSAK